MDPSYQQNVQQPVGGPPIGQPQNTFNRRVVIAALVVIVVLGAASFFFLTRTDSGNLSATQSQEANDENTLSAREQNEVVQTFIVESALTLAQDSSLVEVEFGDLSEEQVDALVEEQVDNFEELVDNGLGLAQIRQEIGPPIRYSGANRYDTIAKVSRINFPNPADINRVVIVNGGSEIDMAIAATLADFDTTVVLVEQRRIPDETHLELERIGTAQKAQLVSVGGSAVIDEGIVNKANSLLKSDIAPKRVVGNSRLQTAAEASKFKKSKSQVAYLASADSYADIMLAANGTNEPIFLVDPNGNNEDTAQALVDVGVESVIVVGGEEAISQSSLNSISDEYQQIKSAQEALASGDPADIFKAYRYRQLVNSGASRLETAIAISRRNFLAHRKSAIIVNGYSAPDMLSAVLLSRSTEPAGMPMVLVNASNYSSETAKELKRLHALQFFVIGGEAAVNERVITELQCAMFRCNLANEPVWGASAD